MAWKMGEKGEWELPKLRESHQIPGASDFWSVEFYPYTEAGVDPIFAVVGGKQIIVCRTPKGNGSIEVIQSIVDEEPETDYFACVWSKDLETGTPLLCVAGTHAKIKVFNVLTGELQRTLAGHGGDINDLAVSPVNPYIIASGSDDCTVRIWSLDPAHAKQPCAAILAGDGHRDTLLSVSFHATGRYLLSGGIDHVINLWVLPDFPDKNTGTNTPTRIHYPHFSTSEVHAYIVDCVKFHHDLILSKAEREHCIVLWSISGFSSSLPPPLPLSAPTFHDPASDTRSAFSHSQIPYTRLLQFSIPDSDIMFMRFGLWSPPALSLGSGPGTGEGNGVNGSGEGGKGLGSVLCMCNQSSKVYFWDLKRLEEYYDYINSLPSSTNKNAAIPNLLPSGTIPPHTMDATTSFSSNASASGGTTKRPAFLMPFRHRTRGGGITSALQRVKDRDRDEGSEVESTSGNDSPGPNLTHSHGLTQPGEKGMTAADAEKSREIWSKRYAIGDPLAELTSHKEETIKGLTVCGRQVSWSRGGEWCVIVGSNRVIGVFERWGGRAGGG